MKISRLLKHIALAVVLSFVAFINELLLMPFLSTASSTALTLSLVIFLYLSFLIWQSPKALGKISLLLIDISLILGCVLFAFPSSTLIVIYLLLIWVNRSLLYHSNSLAILTDLALCLSTLLVTYWLVISAYGLIMVLWCLLLLQSLHCLLIVQKNRSTPDTSNDSFDQAYQAAEKAVQELLRQ
ncbi:MAG: hypothetical protein GQ582_12770 [Methyloprofundus sp.]|nr:hypothetical protein [Methyloprofundus sp.]